MGFFKKEKESFTTKLKKLFVSSEIDDTFYEKLEDLLIESDVSVSTTFEIIEKLKISESKDKIKTVDALKSKLREIITSMIYFKPFELEKNVLNIILVLGVNGVGKTTSIAKLATYFKDECNGSIVLAAGDTFRAAAIEQLQFHGEKLDMKVVKHSSGGDPAAVIFDAIDSAMAKGARLLIADTAGRMHTKENLVNELKKIDKVISSKLDNCSYRKLLVLDATTGQNGLAQAEIFKGEIGVDSIVLTKYDSMSKGGNILSIGKNLGIPVSFVGIGEKYGDLKVFNKEEFLNRILE